MPFYGKHTLQRVYPSWTAARRSVMDRYIQVAYGKPFLTELKDMLNKKRLGKQKPVGKSVSGTEINTRKSKEDQEIPSKTRYRKQSPSQSRLDNKVESSETIKPLGKEKNTAQVRRGKQAIEKKRIEQGEGSKSTPQNATGYGQKKKGKKMQDTGEADINMTASKIEQAGECKSRYPIRTRLKKAVSKTASTDVGENNNSATVAASTDASQDALPKNEAGITQQKSGKIQRLNRGDQEVQVEAHTDTSCKKMPRKLKEDNTSRKDVKKSERSGKQPLNTTDSGDLAVKGRPQQKQSKVTLTSEGNFSGDKVDEKKVNDEKLRSKRKMYKPKKKRPYSKATTLQEIEACSDQLQPDRSSSIESNPKGDRLENKMCLSVGGGSALRDQQSKAANPQKEATKIDHLQKQKHTPMFQKIEPLNMGLKPGTKKDGASSHLVEGGFDESCGFKPAVSDATHQNQDRYPGKRGFSDEAGGVELSQSKPQRSIHEYTQPIAEAESLYDESRSSENQEENVPIASNASLAGSSSFQGSSLTARKILGLRKTARKCCAPQSRHAKEKDVSEIVDVVSSPVSDRTVSPASFARRVSVDIVKLKESMTCCPEAESTPVKFDSVVSGIVLSNKVSLPKRSRSSKRAEDEGKAESQSQGQGQVQVDAGRGFESTDREKLMNPDYDTVTVANWEQNSVPEKSNWSRSQTSHRESSMKGRPSQVGTTGALTAVGLISKTQASALQHDSSSGFGPEHNLLSRCSSASLAGSSSFQGSSFASGKISKTQASALQDDSSSEFGPENNFVSRCSRCEEILSSKDSEGQLSKKKHNKDSKKAVGSFDKNLWDLAVVGDLADGPLLEDDESSTGNDGTETPVSLYHENSQQFDEGSQELNRCSETRPLEEENYKDDSIINESVEDDTYMYTSPIDNVLPGLSRIHHNTAAENRSMPDKNDASPVIGVISCRKTDDPNDGSIKRSKAQSWDIINDRLETADSCQKKLSPDFNETSTASLECGHQNRDDLTKTKKAELPEDEYRSQTHIPIAAVGNGCVVPQLHDQNARESEITSWQDGDVKEMTSSSVMLDSGMENQPQIRKKIRTPAEKKQGWFEPGHSSLTQAALYTDKGAYLGGKLLTQSTRKRRRSESGENRVRGHSGWEDCLRQKPATVAKFQVGDAQKVTKKSGSDQEKKRWQSPTKTTSPPAPTTGVSQPSPAKAFRQVWKPPPAKKLKLTDDADKQMVKKEETENVSTNQQVTAACEPILMQNKFRLGELIWGKMKGFNWWPGLVVHHYACRRDAAGSDACWVKWFGDSKYSKLSLNQVTSFAEFAAHFSQSTLLHTALYRRAVFEALELASTRAGKVYSMDPAEYKTDIPKRSRRPSPDWLKFFNLCNEMIGWAKEGFEPGGLKSILPTKEDEEPPAKPPSPAPPPSPVQTTPTKRAGRSPSKAAQWKDTRDVAMIEIRNGTRDIEDICIGCGSFAVTAQHPFFVGGLCEVCRVEFLEVAYVFDEDGYQAFCCICAEGNDIILCDQAECYRSFCHDCLEYLEGPGTVHTVLSQDHWTCYMCNPEPTTSLISRRPDWPQKLLLFFQQDCNQDFPPLPAYPPVEMDQRKPIRVLSLFDGIGTGMLVLKELGIKVECYYASEISEEAIQVSTVRHDGVIKQLYDIKNITEIEIESLGPFDLMIGGSPCNDLSIANPSRKGLFEGTGRLFFDFYRLLNMVRPPVHSPRPFFWFFENVVGMPHNDKMDISRFLGCAPVVVDAKEVSPAHRARYFWGNIPGMNRPNVATNNNSLCLQDCLEPNCNRQAQFLKVRTVTSKLNSIKQKNEQILPVMMNGQADTLWCTEMERIFGFPEHYTDIANMSRTSRHKLIGQAWSVPVIKHLVAPLKEYFACETSQ